MEIPSKQTKATGMAGIFYSGVKSLLPYFDLLLCIVFYSAQFIFLKAYQKATPDSIAFSLLFIAESSFFGMGAMLVLSGFRLTGAPLLILLAAALGVMTLTCDLSQIVSLRLGSAAVSTTFSMVGGIFIPFVFGIALLHESLSIIKLIALLLVCFSFLPEILSIRRGDRVGAVFLVLCFICFAANGAVSVISKTQADFFPRFSSENFMFFAYLFCLASALVVFAGMRTPPVRILRKAALPTHLYAFLFSVFNSLGNIFSLGAARTIDSSVQFPVISGGVIVVSAIFYRILFKEKQSLFNIVCMAFSIIAIALFLF